MPEQRSMPVRLGEVTLFAKGLILIKLREDHEIDLEDVKEFVEVSLTLTNGDAFAVILDGGLTIDVSEEAMNYAARYENKKWLAFAIIVRSIAERLFANYYLKFKRPIRHTKVFTTPNGAEEWLKQFIRIDVPLKYSI